MRGHKPKTPGRTRKQNLTRFGETSEAVCERGHERTARFGDQTGVLPTCEIFEPLTFDATDRMVGSSIFPLRSGQYACTTMAVCLQ